MMWNDILNVDSNWRIWMLTRLTHLTTACMNCQLYAHSMVNWLTLKGDHSICGISKLASWELLAVQIYHSWTTMVHSVDEDQAFCRFFVNILVARPSLLNMLLVEARPWNCFWVVCETNFAAVGYQFWRVVEILLKGPTTPFTWLHMLVTLL